MPVLYLFLHKKVAFGEISPNVHFCANQTAERCLPRPESFWSFQAANSVPPFFILIFASGDLQRPLGPVHNVLEQPHHQPQLDEHIVGQVFQAEFGLFDLADDLQRLLKALAVVAAEAPQPEHDPSSGSPAPERAG